MQTLDQRRAEYAWECVRDAATEKYVNLVKGAPALIMNSGLMQTLAYYNEKGKTHHKTLLDHLLGWLCDGGAVLSSAAEFAAAMQDLYEGDSATYRRATEEALALLRWLRQLAPAAERGRRTRTGTAP